MHATSSSRCRQQRRLKTHAANSSICSFLNALTGDDLLCQVEHCLPKHRERLFPPTETLAMFLSQALNDDRSCQRIVNEAASNRLLEGLRPCSTSTGAYCRARQRLPLEMIRTLTTLIGQFTDSEIPPERRWRCRPVRLIDGSTATLPDTPANQAAFPQQKQQKKGLGFPILRFVGMTCLSSGAVLDVAIGPYQGKGSDEQTLLRQLLHNLKAGDVVLGDAYYCTYFLLAELIASGIDCVFEQNGSRRQKTDFRTGQRLGSRDHLVTYDKPQKPHWMSDEAYASAPDQVTVRELKVDGKILVTTMCCDREVPKQAVKDLYSSRWHIEVDFRDIKTTLGMATLSCKTPEMATKELWVYMLAYNLIRLMMAQSALLADRLPRTISFKHTVQLWLSFTSQRPGAVEDEKAMAGLRQLIAQQQVGNRPGRSEPRAVKRRPKPMPLLTVPREEARAQISRHGHPSRA